MVPEYRYGRRKELQVGEHLERNGWRWGVSRGSRGPVDLVAERGDHRIAVQVKATRAQSISSARLSDTDARRLERSAARLGATPVAAFVAQNDVWFESVPEGKALAEGRLKPLSRPVRRRQA